MDELQKHLVGLAKGRDAEAFGKLYETLWTDLYKFALYCLGNREEAEDAVQDTAIDAFNNIHKLRSEDSFRAWIFAILSRKCKRGIRKLIETRKISELKPSDSTYDPSQDIQLSIEVREALLELKSEERLIILLSVHGFKAIEISKILNKPDGTIRSKRHRAIEKMRINLGGEF